MTFNREFKTKEAKQNGYNFSHDETFDWYGIDPNKNTSRNKTIYSRLKLYLSVDKEKIKEARSIFLNILNNNPKYLNLVNQFKITNLPDVTESNFAITAGSQFTIYLNTDPSLIDNEVPFTQENIQTIRELMQETEKKLRLNGISNGGKWNDEQFPNEIKVSSYFASRCDMDKTDNFVKANDENAKLLNDTKQTFFKQIRILNIPKDVKELHFEKAFPYFFCDNYAKFQNPKQIETFENTEQNYFSGMLSGMNFMLSSLDDEIDVSHIRKLHYYCTRGCVVRENSHLTSSDLAIDQDDFDNPEGFAITSWSEEGIQDNIKLMAPLRQFGKINFSLQYQSKTQHIDIYKNVQQIDSEALKDIDTPFNWSINKRSLTDIEQAISFILNQYHEKIKNLTPQEEDKKLTIIIETIKTLELLHPFNDANCRTFCMLLLNELLIKNQLSPVILTFDPNNFDGNSVEDIKKMVREGQDTYQKLFVKDPNAILFPDYIPSTLVDTLSTLPLLNFDKQLFKTQLLPIFLQSIQNIIQQKKIEKKFTINHIEIFNNYDKENIKNWLENHTTQDCLLVKKSQKHWKLFIGKDYLEQGISFKNPVFPENKNTITAEILQPYLIEHEQNKLVIEAQKAYSSLSDRKKLDALLSLTEHEDLTSEDLIRVINEDVHSILNKKLQLNTDLLKNSDFIKKLNKLYTLVPNDCKQLIFHKVILLLENPQEDRNEIQNEINELSKTDKTILSNVINSLYQDYDGKKIPNPLTEFLSFDIAKSNIEAVINAFTYPSHSLNDLSDENLYKILYDENSIQNNFSFACTTYEKITHLQLQREINIPLLHSVFYTPQICFAEIITALFKSSNNDLFNQIIAILIKDFHDTKSNVALSLALKAVVSFLYQYNKPEMLDKILLNPIVKNTFNQDHNLESALLNKLELSGDNEKNYPFYNILLKMSKEENIPLSTIKNYGFNTCAEEITNTLLSSYGSENELQKALETQINKIINGLNFNWSKQNLTKEENSEKKHKYLMDILYIAINNTLPRLKKNTKALEAIFNNYTLQQLYSTTNKLEQLFVNHSSFPPVTMDDIALYYNTIFKKHENNIIPDNTENRKEICYMRILCASIYNSSESIEKIINMIKNNEIERLSKKEINEKKNTKKCTNFIIDTINEVVKYLCENPRNTEKAEALNKLLQCPSINTINNTFNTKHQLGTPLITALTPKKFDENLSPYYNILFNKLPTMKDWGERKFGIFGDEQHMKLTLKNIAQYLSNKLNFDERTSKNAEQAKTLCTFLKLAIVRENAPSILPTVLYNLTNKQIKQDKLQRMLENENYCEKMLNYSIKKINANENIASQKIENAFKTFGKKIKEQEEHKKPEHKKHGHHAKKY